MSTRASERIIRKREEKKEKIQTGGTVIVVSKVLVDSFPLFRLYNGDSLGAGLFLDHGVRREERESERALFVCFLLFA